MPHQLCWLLTHQPQLRRSIVCRTWQKFLKVKKKKEKNLVAELMPLPLLSLFSYCHLTSPVISLYYSSFLNLPYLSISSPSSHVLSCTTILYFSFILCGSCGLLVYEPPDISCEFTVVFWNLKQLFEILNFNYTCFHLLIKIMCLFLLLFFFIVTIQIFILFIFISPSLLLLLMLKFKY